MAQLNCKAKRKAEVVEAAAEPKVMSRADNLGHTKEDRCHSNFIRARYGGFPKWGYPKWMVDFIENPTKIDELEVHLFQEAFIHATHV